MGLQALCLALYVLQYSPEPGVRPALAPQPSVVASALRSAAAVPLASFGPSPSRVGGVRAWGVRHPR